MIEPLPMRDPKTAVREYFARDVDGYRAAYGHAGTRGEIFRERRRLVLSLVRDPVGRVLDVGAGPGVFTPALRPRSTGAVVTDLSAEMLLAARADLGTARSPAALRYVAADAESLAFRDASFDTVLCVGVVQYLLTPHVALVELARVTRLGGQVLLTFPNASSPLNRLHRSAITTARAGRASLRRLGIGVDVSARRLTFRDDIPNAAFTLAPILEATRGAGLDATDVVCHGLHFPFSLPPLAQMWNALARRAPERIGRRCGREMILRLARVR